MTKNYRFGSTISDKIVNTFTPLTSYFVTVIPFCLLACPFSPFPRQPILCCNCCDLGEQTCNIEWGSGVSSAIFFRDKKSGVSWWTNSAMERQCLNQLRRPLKINSASRYFAPIHCNIYLKLFSTYTLSEDIPGKCLLNMQIMQVLLSYQYIDAVTAAGHILQSSV